MEKRNKDYFYYYGTKEREREKKREKERERERERERENSRGTMATMANDKRWQYGVVVVFLCRKRYSIIYVLA